VKRLFGGKNGMSVLLAPYKPDFPAFLTGFYGVETAVFGCMVIQV
jgi:hypothetical protein